MASDSRRINSRVLIAFGVLTFPLSLFVVELVQVPGRSNGGSLWFSLTDGMGPAFNSLLAAALTTILVVALSLGIASLALRSQFMAAAGAVRVLCLGLGLTVVPFFLGVTSFAFLWSSLLEPLRTLPFIADRGFMSVVFIDVFAQTLRYVPLLAWLLFIVGLETAGNRVSYERANGFSTRDFIRDELGHPWALLCLVVGAFAFQDSANDYVVTFLALRPSPATETELISHFLQRQFSTSAIGHSAAFAIDTALVGSLLFAVSAIAVFASVASPLIWLKRLSARHYSKPNSAADRYWIISPRWGAALILVPLLAVLCALAFRLLQADYAGWGLVYGLGRTIVATLMAALASWLAAVILMFGIRDGALKANRSAQKRLTLMGICAVTVGFLPPIGIALVVQAFVFEHVGTSEAASIFGWFIAEVARLTPIMSILLIPALISIEDRQFTYLRQVGASFVARLSLLFLGPQRTMHFALLLIAWAWLLNEGIVSAIFQADLPSFSELMLRATSGRSAAYAVAATLVTIEMLLFIALCCVWAVSVYSSWRGRNALPSAQ